MLGVPTFTDAIVFSRSLPHLSTMRIALMIALFVCCCDLAFGQQAVGSAGGDASSTSGSVAFTLGQVAASYMNSSGGSVAQGVQQPYTLLPTAVDDPNEGPGVTIGPNPATYGLSVAFSETPSNGSTYVVLDAKGRAVLFGSLGVTTWIGTAHLPAATYTLQLFSGSTPASYPFIKQ